MLRLPDDIQDKGADVMSILKPRPTWVPEAHLSWARNWPPQDDAKSVIEDAGKLHRYSFCLLPPPSGLLTHASGRRLPRSTQLVAGSFERLAAQSSERKNVVLPLRPEDNG